MLHVTKFAHDENMRMFNSKLQAEADPAKAETLRKLMAEEEERYRLALRAIAERPNGKR